MSIALPLLALDGAVASPGHVRLGPSRHHRPGDRGGRPPAPAAPTTRGGARSTSISSCCSTMRRCSGASGATAPGDLPGDRGRAREARRPDRPGWQWRPSAYARRLGAVAGRPRAPRVPRRPAPPGAAGVLRTTMGIADTDDKLHFSCRCCRRGGAGGWSASASSNSSPWAAGGRSGPGARRGRHRTVRGAAGARPLTPKTAGWSSALRAGPGLCRSPALRHRREGHYRRFHRVICGLRAAPEHAASQSA